MPKKSKPNSKDAGNFNPVPYKESDFSELANILKVAKLEKDLRSQLEVAAHDYFIDKNRWSNMPRSSNIKAALMEIQDKTKSLIVILERIDNKTLDKLAMTSFPDNLDDYNFLSDLQWNKKTDIHKVYSAAQKALSELDKDKGGPQKSKAPLRNFIHSLQTIYEGMTGLKASISWHPVDEQYQGKFFNFVYGCLEIINPSEIWSNSSLGQQIKQVLKST